MEYPRIIFVMFALASTNMNTASSLSLSYTGEACDGDTLYMYCKAGYEIQVTDAFYGRNDTETCIVNPQFDGNPTSAHCSVSTATAAVSAMCDGEGACTVPASLWIFDNPGDCQGGFSKYLKVAYTCEKRIYSALVCEFSGKLSLACPDNHVIQAISAIYGREADSSFICPHETVPEDVEECLEDSATDTFRQMCDGRTSCTMMARNTVFGDPCVGMYKYLKLEYSCAGCVNEYGDDAQCQLWANQGECILNHPFMMLECRKACTRCDNTPPECANVMADDECERWSDACHTYPAWGVPYCRQTCLGCDREEPLAECEDHAPSNGEDGNCTTLGVAECRENPYFMLPVCTATCFRCQTSQLICRNERDDDLCDEWAADSQCDLNPGFMITNCTKSCLQCQDNAAIACVNAYTCENAGCDVDGLCAGWAEEGYCEINPGWMLTNCYKACMQCEGIQPVCENTWGNNAECDYWRNRGDCESDDWMWENCARSCTNCIPEDVEEEDTCVNAYGNDEECELFALEGDCYNNPAWMIPFCLRTCTRCDVIAAEFIDMIGQAALPGEALEMPSSYTIILAAEFPAWATLTHFTAFFVKKQVPVRFQIWQPDGTTFKLVYEQEYVSTCESCSATIATLSCFYLRPWDRLGFTVDTPISPIAYNLNTSAVDEGMYYRHSTAEREFSLVMLPYTFSFAAGYDVTQVC